MLPERPLEAVVGLQGILIIISTMWYHLIVPGRLNTTTASGGDHSRAAGHCHLPVQPATRGFHVQHRKQLGSSRHPALGQPEEDGVTVAFASQPCLHKGRDLSQSQRSSQRAGSSNTLGMCQSMVANASCLGRQTTSASPSAFSLNFLEQEDCSDFK